jgi:murein DD-endopeptidase MepM/ murein hydrolase activator NlpD
MWKELTSGYKDTYDYVKKVANTEDGTKKAAKYICEHYEVGKGLKSRQNKAVEYFKKVKKISSSSSAPNGRGWVWPTPGYGKSYITSWFGENRGYSHGGIDIGAPMGAKVVAGRAGKVSSCFNGCSHNYGKSGSCGCGGGFGNNVYLDHGDGYVTIYGHMKKITVSQGQTVSAGQKIGEVGSTGWSTGPHLHYELHINGEKRDPMNLYSDGDIR